MKGRLPQSPDSRQRGGFDPRLIVLYVLVFAAGGVIQPFLTLYLQEVGLSGTEIGVIFGWASLLAVVFTPLIGMLSDRTQMQRLIFALVSVFKGLSPPLMLLGSSNLWLAFTVSLRVVTAGASDALLTPLTFVHLREQGRNQKIGSIRFWGVAGFSTASLLAGLLARGRSVGVLFPAAAVLVFLSLGFLRVLPPGVIGAAGHPGPKPKWSFQKPSPGILALLAAVFIFSAGFSGPETFANPFLSRELEAGNDFIGLIGAVAIACQLPGFLIADRLNEAFGADKSLIAGFSIIGIGWLGFLVARTPLQYLPFVVFQGVGMGIYWISMFVILQESSRSENATTDLMIAKITLPGLAGMLAKPLSGLVYDQLGGRILFLMDVVLIILAIGIWIYGAKKAGRDKHRGVVEIGL